MRTPGDELIGPRAVRHLHRRVATGRRAVAELAPEVVAPREDDAVAALGVRRAVTGCDSDDRRNACQPVGRAVVVLVIAGAELSLVVVAPPPDAVVALQRQVAGAVAGDADDVGEGLDLHRRQSLRDRRSVSRLSDGVVAPCPDAAVAAQRNAVRIGARNRDDIGQPGYPDRCQSPDRRAVAQLAGLVRSPGPNGAVGLERQRVVVPGRDRRNARQSRHLDRLNAVQRGAVAELADRIVAPRPDSTVDLHRNRMEDSARGTPDTIETGNSHRKRAIDVTPIAQLAGGVKAPCSERAVVTDHQAVEARGRDRRRARGDRRHCSEDQRQQRRSPTDSLAGAI